MAEKDARAGPAGGSEGMRRQIDRFLAAHSTLALSTVSPQGMPASAAVFYAHDERLNLYFLSEERTQHGQNLAAVPRAAGAIQADQQDWRAIRGLQLAGSASLAPAAELAHAAGIYGRKFAFVAALMAGGVGPGELRGPLARARFYVLRPRWFRLIDNTVSFGYKQELYLESDMP